MRLDPHSHADLDQGRVTHMDLVWSVDFDAHTLSGLATLHLDAPRGGELHLDTRDLTIYSVTDQDGAPLEHALGEDGGFMGRRLTVHRTAGTARVAIAYTTSPDASALQWLEPANTAGGEHPFLFSQCQPTHARSIVPCQDSPRARFTFTAVVSTPVALRPVMAAAPGEEGEAVSGWRTTSFSMPQPIPSYLLAIAVGDLESRDLGPRSRVYAEPATLDAAAWEFEGVDAMLLAAEDLFGPYPWDRFDFLVMPPAFPYGCMENPRLTFLTPTLLAGDRSLVAVLAHELAHSWTGNLVTNATMNDFWLNEGFTVWAERRILEVLEGEAAVALAAAIGRHDLQADIDRFGPSSPLTRLENDLEGVDPDDVYSVVPYEKGFLFVVRLEQELGRERWDALVRRYMERFAFTSIATPDLEAFLDEEVPGLLAAVGSEAWIRGSGLPADAPVFPSQRLTELQQLATGWAEGARPEGTDGWTVAEWLVYLQQLPRPLAAADCAWLDEHCGLNTTGNAEILSEWLQIAVPSGYEPADTRLAEVLSHVGRMKFLKPLYTVLHARDPERARAWFADWADRYHPIARQGLEALLG